MAITVMERNQCNINHATLQNDEKNIYPMQTLKEYSCCTLSIFSTFTLKFTYFFCNFSPMLYHHPLLCFVIII